MNKLLKIYLLLLVTAVCFASCNNSSVKEDNFDSSIDEVQLSEALIKIGLPYKLDYLIDNLKLSNNMLLAISSQKNLYNNALLNNYENAKMYTTSRSKAVNLGIYGAELNYLIHFGQTQNSLKYLIASKQLAGQIGVAMAFDQETMDEYQSNMENKDTLINIVLTAYDNVKKMLKSEDQFLLSTLVITGSWLENMYITTNLLPLYKNEATKNIIISQIIQQHGYLKDITDLMSKLNEGDNIFVNDLLLDLQKIDSIYVTFGDTIVDMNQIGTLNSQISSVREKIIKIQ